MTLKKRTNLEIINDNLPLIPKDIPNKDKIKLAKKKVKFVEENSHLFKSTGSYIMTFDSVKNELNGYAVLEKK